MWYFIVALIFLLIGFIVGVFTSGDVKAELVAIKSYLSSELSKLHSKLDTIHAAVKK